MMERRHSHTAVQVFKALNNLCPMYLKDWFMYAKVLQDAMDETSIAYLSPK